MAPQFSEAENTKRVGELRHNLPMRTSILFLVSFAPIALAQAGGVRLLLGLTDTAETAWDGAASVRGAKITELKPADFFRLPKVG